MHAPTPPLRLCARLHSAVPGATPMPSRPVHGTVSVGTKGLPYLLPALHTASHLPPVSAAYSPISSPFTPSPSIAHSSLCLALFVGLGGTPRRGVPHQTYGTTSLSLELNRAVVAPPQPSVSHPRTLPPPLSAHPSSGHC
jgi:hypothetical protein